MHTTINYYTKHNFYETDGEEIKLKKLQGSIRQFFVFSNDNIEKFEINVNEIVKKARNGVLKQSTVNVTPLRTKYFFGERYTYGSHNLQNGIGTERLYPQNSVDPIPTWITTSIINPLTRAKILPENFVNSVVINDYLPGGCIVSHIDPPHIFDRPIVSLSLFSNSALCFGCKFQYRPLRCSNPLLKLEMPRGVVTALSGYAANEITHCVRPEDITQRRTVIMLRRVHNSAPRLPQTRDISSKILKNNCPLILTASDFMKCHQALLKWKNRGGYGYYGKICKRYSRKNDSNPRYTGEFYNMS